MSEIKVAVDAGHGMGTPGKRTPEGEREWWFNAKVATAVQERLETYGIKTMRVDDVTGQTDVSLSARVAKANAWKADLYVSCHHNANTSVWGDWGGVETFSLSASSTKATKLARYVHKRLVTATGLRDRGVKHANYQVLRGTNMPAILTEGGFLDSRTDIIFVRNTAWLASQGYAIADGVAEYFGLKVKSTSEVKPASTSKEIPESISKLYYTKTFDRGVILSASAGVYSDKSLKKEVKRVKKGTKLDIIGIAFDGDYPRFETAAGYITTNRRFIKAYSISEAYEVKKGDTLYSIAKEYGTSVAELKELNKLKSDDLVVGQKLKF